MAVLPRIECSEQIKKIAYEDAEKEGLSYAAYVRQLILRERKRKEGKE